MRYGSSARHVAVVLLTGLLCLSFSLGAYAGAAGKSIAPRLATAPDNSGSDARANANATPNKDKKGPYVLDDGSAETVLGQLDGGQMLWLNRFTPSPSAYPVTIKGVKMKFGKYIHIGDTIEILILSSTTGEEEVLTGTLIATVNVHVQSNKLKDWNEWTFSPPIVCPGPGDILVGAINRSGADEYLDFPAALDKKHSKNRSWVGSYSPLNPADPPAFPPNALWTTVDGLGYPGNWMIRPIVSESDDASAAWAE
jgi:hypothetical protein